MYRTFATAQTSGQHLDREYLGFSPREYDLVANSSADQTSLATLYDLPRYQLTDRAIGELPRLARRILVYLGDRQLKTEDGIDVWPFDRFAAAVADGSLWP